MCSPVMAASVSVSSYVFWLVVLEGLVFLVSSVSFVSTTYSASPTAFTELFWGEFHRDKSFRTVCFFCAYNVLLWIFVFIPICFMRKPH